MHYLLDTNICISIINQKSSTVLQRLLDCEPGEVWLSSITVAELRYGATKSKSASRNHSALDNFLASFEIADFDTRSAIAYGAIRTELEKSGTPIGPLDTLIAAQAVAYNFTLVTDNVREFKRVKKLAGLENWLTGKQAKQ